MENKIPTAEEFFDNYDLDDAPIEYNDDEAYAYLKGQRAAYKLAIEFAKLHIKAAKCEICHQMDLQLNNSQEAQEIVENSYPEENIK